MDKKLYIPILEEIVDKDGLICSNKKKMEMNWLEEKLGKIILRILTPKLEEIVSDIDEMKKANAKLQDNIKKLQSELSQLKTEKIVPLLETHNAKIASLDNKYREAIKKMSDLYLEFEQCIPIFGRPKCLETLQMLVEYLYNPTKELRTLILSNSNETENDSREIKRMNDRIKKMHSEIENFNDTERKYLEEYLSSIESNWENCVFYPKENLYNSRTMFAFDGSKIEEGTPVYIVSIGYKFPNSNAEPKLPLVIGRELE